MLALIKSLLETYLGGFVRLIPSYYLFGSSYRDLFRYYYPSNGNINKNTEDLVRLNLSRIIALSKKTSFYNADNESIEQFSFINKETIMLQANRFLISKAGADYITTGGTSGKPLAFYINKNRKGIEWFWMTHNWSKVGFDVDKSWRAVLRNHKLHGKKVVVNRLMKEYQFDNFNQSAQYLDFVIDFIERKQIPFVHAYPSAAFHLAKRALSTGKKLPCVQAFLCGSENVLPAYKELIQNELGIRMYTWYGHSEKLILAGEGKTCENYHALPLYGYAELIDENEQNITQSGQTGELVGTGFINTVMPFIRYRTGDYAEYVGETCPDCGHIGLTFKNVTGRWDGEKIYTSNGGFVTTTALNMHNDIYDHISNFQYYQDTVGKLEVRVVPLPTFTQQHKVEIKNEIIEKVGEQLVITVVEVPDIEYTINRKYKLLVQKAVV